MTRQEEIEPARAGHDDMHDITSRVAAVVERSRIRTGTVHVFNVDGTAVS